MLRPYQEQAVKKMLWGLTLEGNDLVVMAQGAGKTHVIAEFVKRYGKSILILVPSKELLEQNLEKLTAIIPDSVGVYSASMNSKEIKPITIGTIQSVYKNPELFNQYRVVLVDECDLIDPKNLDGMYTSFFQAIGNPKVIGLTATPFRLGVNYERWGRSNWMVNSIHVTKMIMRIKPFFWSRVLDVVNVKDLQDAGFLGKLDYKEMSLVKHDEIPTNKTQSEFDLGAFEEMVCNDYTSIGNFISELEKKHKKILVFCSSVEQANALSGHVFLSRVITAETTKKARERGIEDFRHGSCQTLFGVGIFTVGFNVPEIDAIVVLRPTKSLRLWTQVIGRGTRLSEGKTHCTVYDLVDNTRNLGRLETMEIKRVDNKWNVVSETKPLGWHGVALYTHNGRPKKTITF